MMILVRNITYGYYGKNDHIFTVKNDDTLLSLKEKILAHFKISKKIDMFDDKTEQLLDDFDQPLSNFFSPKEIFHSLTFGE